MKSREDSTNAALDLHGLPDEETSSGCFDFRHRARSFELRQTPSKHKLTKLANLLRSRSDDSVRSSHSSATTGNSPRGSPRASPRSSPGPPTRRRFMRVVRDSDEADPENPNVVYKYSPEFLSSQKKSSSLDEYRSSPSPYTVSGHTILKKQPLGSGAGWNSSTEQVPESSPTLQKHASFRDEVEVMEYDRKEKIRRGPLAKHKVRLHDETSASSVEEEDSDGVAPSGGMGEDNQKKRLTFKDSLGSAVSLDEPSENSDLAYVFAPVAPPPNSTRTTGLSEWSGESSECSEETSQIQSNETTGTERSTEGSTQSQTTESLQKLNINNPDPTHPSNAGPT